ncbi:MAG: type II secretion system protein [Phycisphaerae bacterium]
MSHTIRKTRIARPAGGFTLVELLVVIVIILMLMGILVPTVRSVMETITVTEARTRLKTLDQSIQLWGKQNAGYFPGQILASQSDNPLEVTGSHLAAEALFTAVIEEDGKEKKVFPSTTAYAEFESGQLMDYEIDGKKTEDVLSDGYSDAMPILYYPARTDMLGKAEQYQEDDNAALLVHSGDEANTGGKLTDVVTGNPPVNNGTYLLIGAGPDRLYFTPDDINNFGFTEED